MSANLQVGAITYGVERNAIRIIASGKMKRGRDFTDIFTYNGVLKDGKIMQANNKVEER